MLPRLRKLHFSGPRECNLRSLGEYDSRVSTARRIEASQLTAAVADHAEGPIWDARAGLARWVDMPPGLVNRLDLRDGGADAMPTIQRVADFAAIVRPRANGGWVVCTRDTIRLCDDAFGLEREIAVPMVPGERFNDGTAAPDGTFYCGTLEHGGAGRLLRLQPDGRLDTVLTDVTVSNGISATPDGQRMIYIDSATQRVDVFDLDEHGLHDRRTLVDLDGVVGAPDGLAVDETGGVWVAMWGGRSVRGYDADGELVAIIDVPTIQPSACAFVGDDLRTLLITTSTQDLAPGEDALAGALFAAEPGVAGLPPLPFAG